MDDHLVTVNSLNGRARDVARLVGAALGGVIAAIGGIALLSLADMMTFALAAGLLWRIRTRPRSGAVMRPHVLREWVEGMRSGFPARSCGSSWRTPSSPVSARRSWAR